MSNVYTSCTGLWMLSPISGVCCHIFCPGWKCCFVSQIWSFLPSTWSKTTFFVLYKFKNWLSFVFFKVDDPLWCMLYALGTSLPYFEIQIFSILISIMILCLLVMQLHLWKEKHRSAFTDAHHWSLNGQKCWKYFVDHIIDRKKWFYKEIQSGSIYIHIISMDPNEEIHLIHSVSL